MQIFEYEKQVSQPQLREELLAAGVVSEWDEGDVSRTLVVQIVTHGRLNKRAEWIEESPDTVEVGVPDGTAKTLVDAIVAAHDRAPAELLVAAAPTIELDLADALEALPDGPLTKKDLADVIATLRGDA